jgi:hypothetical protein
MNLSTRAARPPIVVALLTAMAGCASNNVRLFKQRNGEIAPHILWSQEVASLRDPPLRWKGDLPSNPAVALGGNILLPTKDALICFAPDGRRLWDYRDGSSSRRRRWTRADASW